MLNLSKFKITHKGLYWGLIITFAILYLCVGFVSTLHSITFFNLANSMWLAILLGLTYEVGQASVLFSILMTKNKDRFLPWALMILLTALQVTANVYASFKFMVSGGSMDWQYWQKSILFGVQASSPEMYQVIISWISGALLPVVALGMTALVAENIKMMTEEDEEAGSNVKDVGEDPSIYEKKEIEKLVRNVVESEDEDPSIDEKLKEEFEKYDNINKLASLVPKETVSSAIVKPQVEITLNNELYPDPAINFPIKTPLNLSQVKNVTKEELENPVEEIDHLDKESEIWSYPVNYEPQIDLLKTLATKDKPKEEPKVGEQFQKELIIPDKPKKKAGRPPKTEKTVAVSKKAQEPLQKEEVKVPKEKKHRISNPLNKKGIKPQVIKHIEQINPTSKGEELIESLKDEVKPTENSAPIEELVSVDTSSPEPIKEYKDGIEVVDIKAVPIKKK